jgi:hypothetical protein
MFKVTVKKMWFKQMSETNLYAKVSRTH